MSSSSMFKVNVFGTIQFSFPTSKSKAAGKTAISPFGRTLTEVENVKEDSLPMYWDGVFANIPSEAGLREINIKTGVRGCAVSLIS